MNINKRKFTGDCVPLCTPLGKILINSKESREISNIIRHLKKGEIKTIKLSQETINIIREYESRR